MSNNNTKTSPNLAKNTQNSLECPYNLYPQKLQMGLSPSIEATKVSESLEKCQKFQTVEQEESESGLDFML